MKPNNPPMICIAGGAGYIESHANKILNKRGFETAVYERISFLGIVHYIKIGIENEYVSKSDNVFIIASNLRTSCLDQ